MVASYPFSPEKRSPGPLVTGHVHHDSRVGLVNGFRPTDQENHVTTSNGRKLIEVVLPPEAINANELAYRRYRICGRKGWAPIGLLFHGG